MIETNGISIHCLLAVRPSSYTKAKQIATRIANLEISVKHLFTSLKRIMLIEKKVALVTGGAEPSGIAYTEELLRNDIAHVVIVDQVRSDGQDVAKELNEKFGKGRVKFVAGDISCAHEYEGAVMTAVEEFGGLDILINNANLLDELQWDRMVNANIKGAFLGNLLAFKYMGLDKGYKGGVLVNVASVAGIDPLASLPAYVTTKHAVLGMSRAFAMPYHYSKTGIRVLTFCPGVTDLQLVSSIPAKTMNIVDRESVVKELNATSYPVQQVSHLAVTLMPLLRRAENGTIWVVEGGEPPYEISMPSRLAMKISR